MDKQKLLEKVTTKLKKILAHSSEFKKILALKDKNKIQEAIKAITHATPLLVFWVDPKGVVLDAGTAHRDNPPSKDKSIFSDPTNKGHLRGRSALIGKKVYIVIYLNSGKEDLTVNQLYLLRKSYPKILKKLEEKHPKLISQIQNSLFVTESGDMIAV